MRDMRGIIRPKSDSTKPLKLPDTNNGVHSQIIVISYSRIFYHAYKINSIHLLIVNEYCTVIICSNTFLPIYCNNI